MHSNFDLNAKRWLFRTWFWTYCQDCGYRTRLHRTPAGASNAAYRHMERSAAA